MSELTSAEKSAETNAGRRPRVQTNQTSKVLWMKECPSCFRKGTIELHIHKQGEFTYCYSCGHREASFSG